MKEIKKGPAPRGIQTHYLQIMRRVVYRCATTLNFAQFSDQVLLPNETNVTLEPPSKSLGKTSSSNALVKFLKEFNEQEEGRRFDSSLFSCNVCFAEKLGSQSIRFPGERNDQSVILKASASVRSSFDQKNLDLR